MKTYTLKLKTTSTTNYNLYDGTTLVSDTDLGTLFGSAGEAYFTFDFNSLTPTNTTSLTILDSQDTAVITNTGLSGIAEDKNFKGTWSASATAFDSFTLLTGVAMDEAQLGKLAGMIKDGGIKTLTTADYNYPTTGTKTAIALWLLEPGYYRIADDAVWRPQVNDASGTRIGGLVIVGLRSSSTSTYRVPIIAIGKGNVKMTFAGVVDYLGALVAGLTDPAYAQYGGLLSSWDVQNNLTSAGSAASYLPLSANQGRMLKNLIDSLVVKNAGAPTTSTTGTIGQLIEDTTNGDLYQLKSIDTSVTPNTYNWEQVGGSSVNVVQTTGTSTTDVMSQKAASELVYKTGGDMTRIQIGQLASATASGNYPIAIGVNATINGIQNNATAIGHFANAGSNFALAIGSGTSSSTSPQAVGVSSIALGTNSYASVGAVAFAYGSATAKGQFDVGTSRGSGAGYGSTEYRLITGVYDPQSAHDAATKGYVDGLVGNVESALNVINNGTGA